MLANEFVMIIYEKYLNPQDLQGEEILVLILNFETEGKEYLMAIVHEVRMFPTILSSNIKSLLCNILRTWGEPLYWNKNFKLVNRNFLQTLADLIPVEIFKICDIRTDFIIT